MASEPKKRTTLADFVTAEDAQLLTEALCWQVARKPKSRGKVAEFARKANLPRVSRFIVFMRETFDPSGENEPNDWGDSVDRAAAEAAAEASTPGVRCDCKRKDCHPAGDCIRAAVYREAAEGASNLWCAECLEVVKLSAGEDGIGPLEIVAGGV